MKNDFVVIDVETANADFASICQVGIVSFSDGQIVDTRQSLVNPDDEFDDFNIGLHGIDEREVRSAPNFQGVRPEIESRLARRIVVSHMPFDRVALARAHHRYDLPQFDCQWLDTARVIRRAWSQFAQRGYALQPVAEWCGIEFKHHNAAEDARAAGLILLKAIQDTGLNVEQWLKRSRQPITLSTTGTYKIELDGDPDGPLAGEQLVFTGSLSLTRREAAALAAKAGCDVRPGVTKKTTLLVVGDQDIRKLGGRAKSSKHRKAEALMAAGQPIRILCESDFHSVVDLG